MIIKYTQESVEQFQNLNYKVSCLYGNISRYSSNTIKRRLSKIDKFFVYISE